jgi:radical SAM protein with 4Fe4S-binding SPASM domain
MPLLSGRLAGLPLTLRRERFGGILFDPTDGTYLELDEEGFDLARRWLGGEAPCSPAERAFLDRLLAALPSLEPGPRPHRLHDRAWASRWGDRTQVLSAPTLVDFQITRRCRMGCPHCYASSDPAGAHVAFDEVARVLGEIAAEGACQLALGGGEPLLHPRIVDILERATALGLVPNLTTSGDGMTDEVLRALSSNCGAVALSLEAVGDEFARRRRTGFAFFEQSLSRLLDVGISTVLQVTLSLENLPQLPSIVEYCLKLPLYGVIFLAYKPAGRGRGFDQPLAAAPPEQLFPALRAALVRLTDHTRVGYDCCLTPGIVGIEEELDFAEEDQLDGCSATRSSVGISTDLDVLPCTFLDRRPLGNLRRQSFGEIWRGAAAESFRELLVGGVEREAACRDCRLRASCLGGCPEWNLVGCAQRFSNESDSGKRGSPTGMTGARPSR